MTDLLAQVPTEVVDVLRLDLLGKLGLAVLLGGAVGLERELSGKPAGLRTNILICLGSTLLMDLSISIGIGDNGARIGDPGRIAAQVVTGIGFLGAGTIMQARGSVVGLTTAATIWVVAAIGLLVGAGRFVEAAGATVLVVMVLAGLGQLERRILAAYRTVNASVRVKRGAPFDEIEKEIRGAGVRIVKRDTFEHGDDTTFELRLAGPARQFDVVTARLLDRAEVLSVEFE
jgi:putative Mg2+ transporter-C (MgtC) family protein